MLFQPIGRLIQDIRHIQHTDDGFHVTDGETYTLTLQSPLLFYAGLELLSQQRWTDLDELLDAFDVSRPSDMHARFWLNGNVYQDRKLAGDRTRATKHLNAMLSADVQLLAPTELTVLAEGHYRLLGDVDSAKRLLEGVDQTDLHRESPSLGTDLEPFGQRFRINRLLYALGERCAPSELISETGNPDEKRMVRFEQDICAVAHIWAKRGLARP